MNTTSLLLALIAATSFEGQGVSNRIEIGKGYELDDVEVVLDFTVLYAESPRPDPENSFERLATFQLVLDAEASIGGLGANESHKDEEGGEEHFLHILPVGIPPSVALRREIRDIAIIGLCPTRITRGGKECWSLVWHADVDLSSTGEVFFQLNPNSEELVSISLPFSQADVRYVSRDEQGRPQAETLTFNEMKKRIQARYEAAGKVAPE